MEDAKYLVKAEKEKLVVEKEFENYEDALQFIKSYMKQDYSINIYFEDKKDLF